MHMSVIQTSSNLFSASAILLQLLQLDSMGIDGINICIHISIWHDSVSDAVESWMDSIIPSMDQLYYVLKKVSHV